ncbi:MAG TPA: hypothetical protein VHV55_23465 [Pirellulales bacterium]|nr:hypothetical protein [Pirellulales bacterium]
MDYLFVINRGWIVGLVNRIFTKLAAFAVVFLLATFAVGLSLRAGNLHDPGDKATQQRGTVHRLSGIAAGLVVVLVNSIVATYFIGTSRWCKEVSETYGLSGEHVASSRRLKRRTFPLCVAGMLIAVGIVALGGAADPGVIIPTPETLLGWPFLAQVTWAHVHFAAAGLGIAAIVLIFVQQWNQIDANHEVIEGVLTEVRRIRAERGLED